MPFLSFFADEQDSELLLNWLNAEKEIAFIVQDRPYEGQQPDVAEPEYEVRSEPLEGWFSFSKSHLDNRQGMRRRWKAVQTIDRLTEEEYSLWHVPGGSLPMLLLSGGRDKPIADPWLGWWEQRPGADPRTPYFGAGHTAEVRLELWLRHQPYTAAERATLRHQVSWYTGDSDLLPVSDFQWIGDRYGSASSQTWHWWQRLVEWMQQNAVCVGKFEYRDEDTRELIKYSFWAFPSALEKLKGGMAYYARGHELDEVIRNA